MRYEIRYHGAPYAVGEAGHAVHESANPSYIWQRWSLMGELVRREHKIVAIDARGIERYACPNQHNAGLVVDFGDSDEPDFRRAPDEADARALAMLEQAVAIATAGSNRAYARTIADVSEVTVRRWLSGTIAFDGTALQLARAIVAVPAVADAIRIEPRV